MPQEWWRTPLSITGWLWYRNVIKAIDGNATEHIYEDLYKGVIKENGTAYTNPNLYTQEIINDFYGALKEVTKSEIAYGEKVIQGNWEFIFARPRKEGQLPVIKHALFNGWH